VVCKDSECRNECGTIERKLVFVLPDDARSNPDEIEVRTAANYIYPYK